MLRRLAATLALLALAGCDDPEPAPPTPDAGPPALVEASFTDIPGWSADTVADGLRAFRVVCRRFARQSADKPVSPAWPALGAAGEWSAACGDAPEADDPAAARRFLEDRFTVYAVGAPDETGLFTGYFEPEIDGARARGGRYQTPIYRVPDDLISVDLGLFAEKYEGQRILGRVEGQTFIPYFERSKVASGALDGRGLALAWLADPVDGFFLEIQGSGRIRLENGDIMRVGYAGKNGRAYRAIGRDLIERGAVRREDMSMQAIRDWLSKNPDDAQAVMNLNRSVVFFEERQGPGPVGAAGTALTPGRSLAVDPAFVPLGGLVFLDIAHPDAETGAPPIQRLVAAEDVGGAIKGAIRGDLFWGSGDAAGAFAGRMISRGRYYLLRPKPQS